MSTTENGHHQGSGSRAPLFSSCWLALLLLLRNEIGLGNSDEEERPRKAKNREHSLN